MPTSAYKNRTPELKANIPDSARTPGKDDAAEYIQSEVLDKGRWPMDLTDIADEAGWSRQHIANTLDSYFTFKENGNSLDVETITDELETDTLPVELVAEMGTIQIPDDVYDPMDFVRGWIVGWFARHSQ